MSKTALPTLQISEDLQKALRSLRAPTRGIELFLADLNKALAPVQKMVAEQQAIWARQQAEWTEQSGKIAKGIARFETALEKAESLGKYGWTIPMDADLAEVIFISMTPLPTRHPQMRLSPLASREGRLDRLIETTLANPDLQTWKPLLPRGVTLPQREEISGMHSCLVANSGWFVRSHVCTTRFPSWKD